METVRVPRSFFDDHQSRDLDTPRVVKATKSHYVIDANDPAIPELLNDAEFYSEEYKFMDPYYFGIGRSAVATVKALLTIPGVKSRPVREVE